MLFFFSGINGVSTLHCNEYLPAGHAYANHRRWEWRGTPGILVASKFMNGQHQSPFTGEEFTEADDELELFGIMIEDRMEREPYAGFDNMWEALREKAVDGMTDFVFYKTLYLNNIPYYATPSLRGMRRYDIIRVSHKTTMKGCCIADCWYAQIVCLFNCALGDFLIARYLKKIHVNGRHPILPHRCFKFETKDGKFVDVLINPSRLLMTRESEGSSKPYFVPDHCFNSSKECKSRLQHKYFDYNFY
jgi:hypothetical protein